MRIQRKESRDSSRPAWASLLLLALIVPGCPSERPAEQPPSEPAEASPAATSPPEAREWCEDEDECDAYLLAVRNRVFEVWEIAPDVTPGFVVAEISFDERGNLTAIDTVAASDPQLKQSCLEAFRRGEPFPEPPGPVVGKVLRARFIYGDHERLPAVLLADLESKQETAVDPDLRKALDSSRRTLEKVIEYWSQHPREPLPTELRREYVSILEDL